MISPGNSRCHRHAAEAQRLEDLAKKPAYVEEPAPAAAAPVASGRIELPVAAPAAAPVAAPVAAPSPAVFRPVRAAANEPAAAATLPTLSLGKIGTHLGFSVSASFLEQLGFQGLRLRGAVLYRSSDFPLMRDALVKHLQGLDDIEDQQVA